MHHDKKTRGLGWVGLSEPWVGLGWVAKIAKLVGWVGWNYWWVGLGWVLKNGPTDNSRFYVLGHMKHKTI